MVPGIEELADDSPESGSRRMDVWVFGYGSLVDPIDLGRYVRDQATDDVEWSPAVLDGYERNWRVGMTNIHDRADDKFYVGADGARYPGVVLSLGLTPARSGRTNGVVFRTEPRVLPVLDAREKRYVRVEVTSSIIGPRGRPDDWVVYTYVPRPDAVACASDAIRDGTAAVPRAYHDKVRSAFAGLGADELATYEATTRGPDAPVVDLTMVRPGTPRHALG